MLYGMRVYGQFCPPGAAAEVFARRWTPLIRRNCCPEPGASLVSIEMRRGYPGICLRLGALAHSGIIERKPLAHGRGCEYHLTAVPHLLHRQQIQAWGGPRKGLSYGRRGPPFGDVLRVGNKAPNLFFAFADDDTAGELLF
jgi:DNA-binding HxlR family transcriptional regulator